jgi:hypothetical protein
MNALHLILSLASLIAPATESAAPAGPAANVVAESHPLSAFAKANRDWIAKSTDNVCGLKEASQVSNPAVVDWQSLLEATPEVRKLRSEKIAEDSPEGIQGHCSVWKAIRHKDGRAVTDLTDLVKAQL